MIFCLVILSIIGSGVLMSPLIIVELYISPLSCQFGSVFWDYDYYYLYIYMYAYMSYLLDG